MSHPKSSFYIDKSGSLQVRVRSDGRVWVLDRWSGNDWFELMPMDGEYYWENVGTRPST